MRSLAVLLCWSLLSAGAAMAQSAVRLAPDVFQHSGLALQSAGWHFYPGDDQGWSKPGRPDTVTVASPSNFGAAHPLPGWKGVGWFRLWVVADSAIKDTMLAMRFNHDGASEIWFDGKKIGGIGVVGHSRQSMKAVRSPYELIPFTIADHAPHLIAVRYSNFNSYFPGFIGFQTWAGTYRQLSRQVMTNMHRNDLLLMSVAAQTALVLLHLFLFLFYPQQRLNLYYSGFVLLSALTLYLRYVSYGTSDPAIQAFADRAFDLTVLAATWMAGILLYAISYDRLPGRRILVMSVVTVVLVVFELAGSPYYWANLFFLIVTVDGLRALFVAIMRKKPAVWMVGIGMFILTLFFFIAGGDVFGWLGGNGQLINQWMSLGLLVLPLCFSLYLAIDFARTNRDLGHSERQAAQLQELDAFRSRFIVNLTHELRTPLTLILGPAEQLYHGAADTSARSAAELIRQNARQLLLQVNQLLDLSKLEAGKMVVTIADVDIRALIGSVLSAFESMVREKQIELQWDGGGRQLYGMVDSAKLEMVLYNLLSNAIKFSQPGGRVELSVDFWGDPPAGLEIKVSDTGIGIEEGKLAFVFDRFYQADASDTRSREGSGIGLSLTKELVELLKGEIALDSRVGYGTTVSIRLPVEKLRYSAEPFDPVGEPSALAVEVKPADAAIILVIEDNADLRAFICSCLENHFNTIEAADGAAGIALASEHIPDLVITDLMMPGMDGYEVCKTIREQERTSHIPVVMLTAKSGMDSKVAGWSSGADGYLTKPFQRPELLAVCSAVIGNRRLLSERYGRTTVWEEGRTLLTSQDQIFIGKVRDRIEASMGDERFGVDQLGTAIGLSRTQLHRKLKAIIGQTPGELIRMMRLQRALELLKSNTGNIGEVAWQVGFSNAANFSTSFSRHFGYPPSEVRGSR